MASPGHISHSPPCMRQLLVLKAEGQLLPLQGSESAPKGFWAPEPISGECTGELRISAATTPLQSKVATLLGLKKKSFSVIFHRQGVQSSIVK